MTDKRSSEVTCTSELTDNEVTIARGLGKLTVDPRGFGTVPTAWLTEWRSRVGALRPNEVPPVKQRSPAYYGPESAEPCDFRRGDQVRLPDRGFGTEGVVNSISVRVHVEHRNGSIAHYTPSEVTHTAPRTDNPLPKPFRVAIGSEPDGAVAEFDGRTLKLRAFETETSITVPGAPAAPRTAEVISGWPEMPAWSCENHDDTPLAEDALIKEAFPTRSGRHATYAEAMRLVGARRSKAGLVALVNWILVRQKTRYQKMNED